MKWRTTVVVSFLLLALCVPLARADVAAEVEARLVRDLKYLTSDECEGRGITTKGIDLAAEYIAREFQKFLRQRGDQR